MRRVKIAVAVLLAIGLLVTGLTFRLRVVLDSYLGALDQVEEALDRADDLAEACRAAEDAWSQITRELVRYIPQHSVDDITLATLRLLPLSESEDKAPFRAEVRILRQKIEELWEAHSPSWSSLF